MYIQMISVHGLIRGDRVEMGRDADTGGQVRYALELARTLGTFEEVERVDLFTRRVRDKRVSEDYAEPVERLGPKVRLVRLACGGGRYLRKEKLWPFLDEFADRMVAFSRAEGLAPTLVHGHYADAGYIAREVASAFGAPFVFTGHSLGRDKLAYLEGEGWESEALERQFRITERVEHEEECLALADLVVASTRHERDAQYARYRNGKLPRFEVIPPGTSLERFFPYYEYEMPGAGIDERFKQARVRMSDELDRFHVGPDKPLILALCRPDKRKNIGALVQAYGEDKELQALANLAVFAGIRKNIEEMEEGEREVLTDILLMMDRYDLYGKMAVPKRHDSELEVPELYRLAASRRGVFVNAAFVEPFGLTFIESSATGLPFVGTDNGGPQDIAANCESGLLVDVRNRQELARAVKKLLTDRELWSNRSANGVNRVRQHYSWQAHCEKYLESVREIAGKPAKGEPIAGAGGVAIAPRLASAEVLLVSDIDNTLLGDDDALDELMALVEENSGRMLFGVATGRYKEKAMEALGGRGVERLDVLISSVGTEIYYGAKLAPDKGWASHLRSKWRPDRVRETLDALPFLKLQEDAMTQREFKISYDLDPEAMPPREALPKIREALSRARAPHNLVFSHGVFVDILPYRASKGKAIRYLSGKWNLPLERVATAGDSGNDRDMLAGRSAGIVVGNHDKELEPLKKSNSRVYFAERHRAGGIVEGLRHYGFIEEAAGKKQGGKAGQA